MYSGRGARVLVADRLHDHRRVRRQRAGVVRHEQRAALGGHVLDPLLLDPEPVAVVEVEQRLIRSKTRCERPQSSSSRPVSRAGISSRSSRGSERRLASGRGAGRGLRRAGRSSALRRARALGAGAESADRRAAGCRRSGRAAPRAVLESRRVAGHGVEATRRAGRRNGASTERPRAGAVTVTRSTPRRAVVAPARRGAARASPAAERHAARAERAPQREQRRLDAEGVPAPRAARRSQRPAAPRPRPTARARRCRGRRASARAGRRARRSR